MGLIHEDHQIDISLDNDKFWKMYSAQNLCSTIEILDLNSLKWSVLTESLPFKVYSLKSLSLNQDETLLYGGYSFNELNLLRFNSKLIIFNRLNQSFKEWVDLKNIQPNKEIIEVIINKNHDDNKLIIFLRIEHSESAFEVIGDLLIISLETGTIQRIPQFTNHLEDHFNKKIYVPIDLTISSSKLRIICKHLHIKTQLTEFFLNMDTLENNSSASSEVPLRKTIKSNKGIGGHPQIHFKTFSKASYLFPLISDSLNADQPECFQICFIRHNQICFYHIASNLIEYRQIPKELLEFFNQTQVLFLTDDLVLISSSYEFAKVDNKFVKKMSGLYYIYSIRKDCWIVPFCLKPKLSKSKHVNKIVYVNTQILKRASPTIDHKIILHKNSGKYILIQCEEI